MIYPNMYLVNSMGLRSIAGIHKGPGIDMDTAVLFVTFPVLCTTGCHLSTGVLPHFHVLLDTTS